MAKRMRLNFGPIDDIRAGAEALVALVERLDETEDNQ
jgi:hypothetical protein